MLGKTVLKKPCLVAKEMLRRTGNTVAGQQPEEEHNVPVETSTHRGMREKAQMAPHRKAG